MLNKSLCLECSTIGQVRLNCDTIDQRQRLKRMLCTNRFHSREPNLVLDMHVSCSMINKHASAFVGGRRRSTIGVKSPAKKTGLEVIHRNLDTGLQMFHLESTSMVSVRHSFGGLDGTTMSFGELADCALDRSHITLRRRSVFVGKKRNVSKNSLNSR